MSKRRRSREVALVLIGAAAIPGCMPEPRVVHDRYASLEDCAADWGRPEVCNRDDDRRPLPGNYGGAPRVIYSGPSYPEGDRPFAQSEARQQAVRLGAMNVAAPVTPGHALDSVPARGGFGSSAHFFGRLG